MFPLEFPLRILRKHPDAKRVFDPFCGRGTTLYAARHLGRRAVGIDCSPVAVAISQAKLASFLESSVMRLAKRLLAENRQLGVPRGDFWERAFHPDTLHDLCALRRGLLKAQKTDTSVLLRAIVLGILHGPITAVGSYLSNQMPRTFAPKPDYAVRYWRKKRMKAPYVDIEAAIRRKLKRITSNSYTDVKGSWRDVIYADSSQAQSYRSVPTGIDLVITSPPYYGMRTYVADQWLRNWFLGGPSSVDYSDPGDLPSSSEEDFCEALGRTWTNIASRGKGDMHLYVRFGIIPSRLVDARELMLASLEASAYRWRIVSVVDAKTADVGKRQATHMSSFDTAVAEFDLHAQLI